MEREVQYLRPDQVVASRDANGIIFLPLAPLEWHGPHLPLGVDPLPPLAEFDVTCWLDVDADEVFGPADLVGFTRPELTNVLEYLKAKGAR
jgi:hypothetical protein